MYRAILSALTGSRWPGSLPLKSLLSPVSHSLWNNLFQQFINRRMYYQLNAWINTNNNENTMHVYEGNTTERVLSIMLSKDGQPLMGVGHPYSQMMGNISHCFLVSAAVQLVYLKCFAKIIPLVLKKAGHIYYLHVNYEIHIYMVLPCSFLSIVVHTELD